MLNICFILILWSLTTSVIISCGNGYDAFIFNTTVKRIECLNAGYGAHITPKLPVGMSYENGNITGSPQYAFSKKYYVIENGQDYGFFFLVAGSQLMEIDCGFSVFGIYKNTAFSPIRFFTDSFAHQFSITPGLSNGLHFDQTNGIISGIYSGGTISTEYQITAFGPLNSVKTKLVLEYHDSFSVTTKGISVCHYNIGGSSNSYTPLFFELSRAASCVKILRFNLTEDYETTKHHEWPGLDDRFTTAFASSFSGYVNVIEEEQYQFKIRTNGAVTLYVDSQTSPVIQSISTGSWEREVDGTVHLGVGAHLVRVYFSCIRAVATIEVMYRKIDGVYMLLDDSNMVIGGTPPSFLTVKGLSGIVGHPVSSVLPEQSGTYVDNFDISPPLPSGLSMNDGTGVISGTVEMALYSLHTITATNQLGSYSKQVTVVWGDKALPGLVATYYSIPSSASICYLPKFPESLLGHQATLIVASIDNSLAYEHTSWAGVSSLVFRESAYISWEGFININISGKWGFQVESFDGLRIFLDDEVVVHHWECSSVSHTFEGYRQFNKTGFVPFRAEWFNDKKDLLAIVRIRRPGEFNFAVIPEDLLFHIPDEALTYAAPRATYFQNVAITVNKPYVFGVYSGVSNFHITPQLPAGLLFGTDGTISGRPTTVSSLQKYTVTAMAGSTPIWGCVTLCVEYIAPPTDVIVKDGKGNVVTEISLKHFLSMPVLTVSWTGIAAHITVLPTLPSGLTLSQDSRSISGRPLKSSSLQKYTLTISNDGGFVTSYIDMTVIGCEHGPSFYTDIDRTGPLDLFVELNGQTVAEYKKMDSGLYGAILCYPEGDYSLHFFCRSILVDCSIKMWREDDTLFIDDAIHTKSWKNVTFVRKETVAPTLIVDITSEATITGGFVKLKYKEGGIHRRSVVSPQLPYTVTIKNGVISGSFDHIGVYRFTITCGNDVGSTAIEIKFFIDTCESGFIFLKTSRTYTRSGEGFSIIDSETRAIITSNEYISGPSTSYVCVANRKYDMLMWAGNYGNWARTIPLEIVDQSGVLMGTFILNNGQLNQTDLFSVATLLDERQSYKYLQSTHGPKKTWFTSKFNDKKWPVVSDGSWGSFNGLLSTVFFRTTFNVDGPVRFPSFTVFIRAIGGVVLYVNGREAARMNMPEGDVWYSLPAVRDVDLSQWMQLTLSSDLLMSGSNLIAAELHRFADVDTSPVVFALRSRQMAMDSLFVTDGGIATASDHVPDSRYKPEYAFDRDDDKSWEDSFLPVWIRYTYPVTRRVQADRVVLLGNKEYRRNMPIHFVVYGLVNQTVIIDGLQNTTESRDVLANIINPYLFSSEYEVVNVKLNSVRPYSAYEIEISGTNDAGDRAAINSIAFYADRRTTCNAVKGFGAVDAGEVSYGKCSLFSVGMRQRECVKDTDGGKWKEVEESTCLKRFAGSNEAFIDTSYRIENCTLSIFKSSINAVLESSLVRELMIKKSSLLFYLLRDCSQPSSVPSVCVDLRISPHHLVASFVMMQLEEYNRNITKQFYEQSWSVPQHLTFFVMNKPKLHIRPSAVTVVAIVAVSLLTIIILVFILSYLRVYMKGPTDNVKTLKKRSLKVKTRRDIEKSRLLEDL